MNTQIRTLLEAATKLNDDSMVEELEKLEHAQFCQCAGNAPTCR